MISCGMADTASARRVIPPPLPLSTIAPPDPHDAACRLRGRAAVPQTLADMAVAAARQATDDALDLCASGAIVYQHGDTGQLAFAPTSCHRWACPRCQPGKLARILAMAYAGNPQRKIELTLPGSICRIPLPSRIDHLRKMWRRLLQRIRRTYGPMEWMAALELQASGSPHLHILCRGPYISQRWLSQAWAQLTGAYIVWIRNIERRPGGIAEVVKYLTKTAVDMELLCPGRPIITHSRGWLPDDWDEAQPKDRSDPWQSLYHIRTSWPDLRDTLRAVGARLQPDSDSRLYTIVWPDGLPPPDEDFLWTADIDRPQEWLLWDLIRQEARRQRGTTSRAPATSQLYADLMYEEH